MMNRGHVLQSSPVQQMMAGSPNWWNMINNRKPPPLPHPSFRQPSPNFFPQFIPPPLPPSRSWHDDNHEELPDSWSQLLFGGLVGDQEDKAGVSPIQPKKLENWEEEIVQQAPSAAAVDIIKQENSNSGSSYVYGGSNAEECDGGKLPADWSHTMPWPASSPNSCVTTLSTNILDFSNNKADGKHPPPDRSSECTIGGGLKKARVQASSTQCFKVRKEKLGDRITALHQLVSPFGKTDTASVLLEAIGYIRFLHAQVEALSVPYLGNGTRNIKSQQFVQGEMNCLFPEDPGQLLNDNSCTKRKGTSAQEDYDEETPKELRSRGLCLVPTSSCTLQVGSGNGADYWAPTFGGGFR